MAPVTSFPHPPAVSGVAGRLKATGAQGLRFALVGTAMTGAQLALYAFLSGSLGTQAANLLAWFLTTVATTAAHRRLTFRLPGPGSAHDHLVGLGTSIGGLLASALVLAGVGGNGLVHTLGVGAATGVAGIGRFLVLAWWMRRGARGTDTTAADPAGKPGANPATEPATGPAPAGPPSTAAVVLAG